MLLGETIIREERVGKITGLLGLLAVAPIVLFITAVFAACLHSGEALPAFFALGMASVLFNLASTKYVLTNKRLIVINMFKETSIGLEQIDGVITKHFDVKVVAGSTKVKMPFITNRASFVQSLITTRSECIGR